MKKVILAPDSFKGTMSSSEICRILAAGIHAHYPDAAVLSIPVADGGEGSVDAFLTAAGGRKVKVRVSGPHLEEIESFYGLLDGGQIAVIEMAACAGLPLIQGNPHVETASTYGVGQLIAHAAAQGCRKIIVGLGGSATNDFGAGAATALGIRFLDAQGCAFLPVGESLSRIRRIDRSGLLPALEEIELIAMCDIDNPLFGETGAAYVFAPQKGAGSEVVRLLDEQLRAVSQTVQQELGRDIAQVPGAGAAGGMGGGLTALLNARLQMGIETVLDTVGFDRSLDGTDLVITGEGKLDTQSLRGKVVVGVARRCKPRGVPVVAMVGDIGDGIETVYDEGVSAVFSINRAAVDFSVAKTRSRKDLALTIDNLMRFLRRIGF